MAADSTTDTVLAGLVDLACAANGGQALWASDEFFAEKENLLLAEEPVFVAERYTDRGKWMDGWEPRRRRTPGHDRCIIALGIPGRIRVVDIDTRHFLGNHPPFGAVYACHAPGADVSSLQDEVEWTRIVDQVPLQRGAHNIVGAKGDQIFTHVRLDIYPAGGVARLRVYGDAHVPPSTEDLDLLALGNGGVALCCSDSFFSPMNNLLRPGRSAQMDQGWETRRSRPPGMDWVILALGQSGVLNRIVVDTGQFKGNYPDRCAIDGVYWPDAPPYSLVDHPDWVEIVPQTPLRADAEHALSVATDSPWTHLRLRIYPDGGVARLRAFGRPSGGPEVKDDALLDWINTTSAAELTEALGRCCGAPRWAAELVSARPFTSRTHLFGAADVIWWHLAQSDWHAAFAHHPRIGADVEALRKKFAPTAGWSEGEQSGVTGASEAVLTRLAEGNRRYEERYGFIFIVCASGKTAEEMCLILEARMNNAPEAELRIAAGEQAKITRIRLEKLGDSLTLSNKGD